MLPMGCVHVRSWLLLRPNQRWMRSSPTIWDATMRSHSGLSRAGTWEGTLFDGNCPLDARGVCTAFHTVSRAMALFGRRVPGKLGSPSSRISIELYNYGT